MKILNVVRILLLSVIVLGFVSCGDDNYYLMQNSDDKLCEKTWVDGSESSGVYQLKFYKDNKGIEYTITYSASGTTTSEREFSWRWVDDSKEALKMTFLANKSKFFENVWVRDHYLSGKLDGKIIMFTELGYK